MTQLLEQAFKTAAKLPDPEQNKLAQWSLNEIEAEQRWDDAFANSQGLLAELADEAILEYEMGKTEAASPK